jgi:RNA polymerase sigma-70 factor (ECF subfamily)
MFTICSLQEPELTLSSIPGRDPVGGVEPRDETALLRAVRTRARGWESARSRLLERHGPAVYRRCLKRLRQVHDAEDAFQETMLRALRGMRRFEGRSGLRTWLFAIADNECSSFVHRARRHNHSEHLRRLLQIHEANLRREVVVDGEQRRAVSAALRNLSPNAREVLGLRFYREASLHEIAHILGISLSAAKMRLYRALDQFEARYAGCAGIESARTDREVPVSA